MSIEQVLGKMIDMDGVHPRVREAYLERIGYQHQGRWRHIIGWVPEKSEYTDYLVHQDEDHWLWGHRDREVHKAHSETVSQYSETPP